MLKRLSVLVVLMCLVMAVTLAPTTAEAQPPSNLSGSWEVFDDNSPARFLLTFNSGGTLVVSTADFDVGNGHGSWLRKGQTTFESTDLAFIFTMVVDT